MKKETIVTILILAFSSLPLLAMPLPWEPYSATMVIEGQRMLVEVRAVDESRHYVLATKYLLLDTTEGAGTALQIFEAGVLEHEAHAQVRLQLREGDYFLLEMLRETKEQEVPATAATVTIKVHEGTILARENANDAPVGSIIFKVEPQ